MKQESEIPFFVVGLACLSTANYVPLLLPCPSPGSQNFGGWGHILALQCCRWVAVAAVVSWGSGD